MNSSAKIGEDKIVMLKKMYAIIYHRLKKYSLFRLLAIYFKKVHRGYSIYEKYINQFGSENVFFFCPWHGTGDIFLIGRYLYAYLEKNRIKNFVFLFRGNAERTVGQLYPYLLQNGKNGILADSDIEELVLFCTFMGMENCKVKSLHHSSILPQITRTDPFSGYRGISMTTMYLSAVMNLEKRPIPRKPEFLANDSKCSIYFEENHLIPGRTVILAPYSISSKDTPMDMWRHLASKLVYMGYTVCTNCSRKEDAIPYTTPVFFDFLDSQIFLEKAGYFVGWRSGLCDIISSINCKKVILYPHETVFCQRGRAISYTGVNELGLCNDAVQFEYVGQDRRELISQIISALSLERMEE